MKATVSPEVKARIDRWLAGEVDYWAVAGFLLPIWPSKVLKEAREAGEGGSPVPARAPVEHARSGNWLRRLFGRAR